MDRTLFDYLTGAGEVAATLGTGAIAPLAGGVYGIYKGVTSPNYGTIEGGREADRAAMDLMSKMTYQPRGEVAQNLIGSIGGVMDDLKIPAVTPQAAPLAALGLNKTAMASQVERAGMAAERAMEPAVIRMLNQGGTNAQMLQDMARGSQAPATAWHAGANLFDKFDVTRAPVTGSAYTRGAYAAASRREALNKYLPRTGEKYESAVMDMYKAAEKKRDYESMEVLESAMLSSLPSEMRNNFIKSGDYSPAFANKAENIIKKLEGMPRDSYLYKLDIADEALPDYMLFDRPMGQQPQAVQQYAREVGALGDDMLGGDIVGKLRASGMPEMQIQEALKSRGIPGLIYNSPDVPGSVNYVNYNPDLIKILEVNDTPASNLFEALGLNKPKKK